jgi:hypothetical protein
MLTLLEVRGQGGTLSLPLGDETLGYDVQDIQGLDPVKASLVSSSFAQQDGAQFQSARRDARNITMTLGLVPDYAIATVRSLRQALYPFFMPKSEVSLRFFMDDDLVVDIQGTVETMESAMFTKEPAVDISIMCWNPDFLESNSITLSGNTTAGTTDTTLEYSGTVESGVEFVLNVNRTMSGFTMYHQTPDGTIRTMDVEASLVSGDIVTISTVSGFRFARLTRAGVESSILYGIPSQSNWMEFLHGTNAFRVYASGAAVPYTMTYTRRYGGL